MGLLDFMKMAVAEAKKAYNLNEIPVGCVITYKGQVISQAHNTCVEYKDVTCHAELIAIKKAIEYLGEKDLKECDIYVTLEPCPMCAGAIINTKIKRLYIGAMEPKSGCFGSKIDFTRLGFNHSPEVYYGICEDECRKLMKDFFNKLR